jgi:hypothetical protein
VYLDFKSAHFLCSGVDGCSVLVRFDDKKPESYRAAQPADHSTNTLFIHNHDRFVRSALSAKLLRIEVQFYQDATRVLEFDISGLKWIIPTAAAKPKTPANQSRDKESDVSSMQARMRSCNTDAHDLRGDERRAFMVKCLRGE